MDRHSLTWINIVWHAVAQFGMDQHSLRWLQRSGRPKTMNIFNKKSFTHSNLKTDMTEKRALNKTENIFVRLFVH